MSDSTDHKGPDLTAGVTLDDFDGHNLLRGHVGDDAVVLVRHGGEVHALGASCTHYGGPLDQGIVVGDTVRCPWHHACFSLRTGEAVGAPALDPVACWRVERDGDRIVVREKAETDADPTSSATEASGRPERVLIVGGGATGLACAEMLRRHGFAGGVTLLSADPDAPYDRPSLSKEFLAGSLPADYLALRGDDWYTEHDVDLRLGTRVDALDLDAGTASDDHGDTHEFDCLVLATGAEPVHLPIPGADRGHVFTLRTRADCQAIVDAADGAGDAVLLGSGFIGLEAAAALAARGLTVHVVTLDAHPLEGVVGREVSERIQREHEQHGTVFHTESSLTRIDEETVTLDDGTELRADVVVLGVGVKPRLDLAEGAGLDVDGGVLVDECLRAAPRVYAGGDIARWADTRTGERMRVEHWVLAQRHGQHIARNILQGDTPFTDVPFFWTAHHDVALRYVGHADEWDETVVDGDIDGLDATITYRKDGRDLAVVTLGRDVRALQWEAEHENVASGAPGSN